ncbi:MAG: hypothetical protein QXE31_02330 [Candidatus Woesearchaeota archaeon]
MVSLNPENSESNDIITYDALFELVRNEKIKEELIKINPKIYDQIINYLKSKLEIYKNFKANESEAEKIKTQINSARKLIKEWYEKREKKIALLAITKSRIKNVDESSLLPEEKLMLDELTQTLEKYRQNILLNLINLKKPIIENENNRNLDIPKPILQKEKNLNLEEKNSSTNIIINKTNIEEKNVNLKEINQAEKQMLKLRIFEDLPKFLGTNLEVYGPYKANEIIELPNDLAEVIIKRNKGEKI